MLLYVSASYVRLSAGSAFQHIWGGPGKKTGMKGEADTPLRPGPTKVLSIAGKVLN